MLIQRTEEAGEAEHHLPCTLASVLCLTCVFRTAALGPPHGVQSLVLKAGRLVLISRWTRRRHHATQWVIAVSHEATHSSKGKKSAGDLRRTPVCLPPFIGIWVARDEKLCGHMGLLPFLMGMVAVRPWQSGLESHLYGLLVLWLSGPCTSIFLPTRNVCWVWWPACDIKPRGWLARLARSMSSWLIKRLHLGE